MAKMGAFGTTLMMGQGNTIPGPETFDNIANVTGLGGPGIAADTEDVTTHDSAGAWEEVVVTILRTGEMTMDIVYDPGNGTHDATSGLLSKVDDKTLANFVLVFPDLTEWEFSAFVTGFEPDEPVDGALKAAVSVKITGAPTLV